MSRQQMQRHFRQEILPNIWAIAAMNLSPRVELNVRRSEPVRSITESTAVFWLPAPTIQTLSFRNGKLVEPQIKGTCQKF